VFNFTGIAVLVSLGRFSWLIRTTMAFPVGVGVWGIGMAVCIVLPIALSGLNTVLCTLALPILFSIIYKTNFRKECRIFIDDWQVCSGLLIFFGLLIIGITWFIYFHNYTYFSPDSWRYIFFGDMIAKIGDIPPEHTRNLDEFTAIIPLLTATGRFIGIPFFPFTLFPAYGVGLIVVLTIVIWHKVSSDFKDHYYGWVISALAGAFCISTPVFLVYSFYVNEHILAGINFLIVIVGIHEYAKNGQLKWLRLSGLCMGVLTLQRSEMLLFGVLPFCMLLTASQDRRILLTYLLPFLCISIGWEFYKKITYIYTPLLGRGALLYQGGLLLYYVTAVWFAGNRHIKNLNQYADKILAAALAAILLFAVFLSVITSFTNPIKAMTLLIKVLFLPAENEFCKWGLSWFFIFSVFFMDLLFFRTPYGGLRFLLLNILLTRILLYSFPGIFPGLAHLSSGARILMHFFPVFILYASMVVSYRLREHLESREILRLTNVPVNGLSNAND
jgi:hypothetical protein